MIQFENAIERFGKVILDELKEAKITCWIAGGSLREDESKGFCGEFTINASIIYTPQTFDLLECSCCNYSIVHNEKCFCCGLLWT